jgi:hypothetical protein
MQASRVKMLAVVAALVIEALAALLSEVHEILHTALATARNEEGVPTHPDELRAPVQVEGEAAAFAGVERNFGEGAAYTGGVHSDLSFLWAVLRGCACTRRGVFFDVPILSYVYHGRKPNIPLYDRMTMDTRDREVA